jgi:hypothetical protein
MNEIYPYYECFECTNIICCPHPDVSEDYLPKPIPPENCPKRDEIILTDGRTK